MTELEYKSKNGYKGVLYGSQCYAIFDRYGNKLYQVSVANRYVYSYQELVDSVEKFPKIYNILMTLRTKKYKSRKTDFNMEWWK